MQLNQKLEKGIPEDQIVKMLGKPESTTNDSEDIWYTYSFGKHLLNIDICKNKLLYTSIYNTENNLKLIIYTNFTDDNWAADDKDNANLDKMLDDFNKISFHFSDQKQIINILGEPTRYEGSGIIWMVYEYGKYDLKIHFGETIDSIDFINKDNNQNLSVCEIYSDDIISASYIINDNTSDEEQDKQTSDLPDVISKLTEDWSTDGGEDYLQAMQFAGQINKDMTAEQVKEILGEPVSVNELDSKLQISENNYSFGNFSLNVGTRENKVTSAYIINNKLNQTFNNTSFVKNNWAESDADKKDFDAMIDAYNKLDFSFTDVKQITDQLGEPNSTEGSGFSFSVYDFGIFKLKAGINGTLCVELVNTKTNETVTRFVS